MGALAGAAQWLGAHPGLFLGTVAEHLRTRRDVCLLGELDEQGERVVHHPVLRVVQVEAARFRREPLAATRVEYSLLERGVEREVLPACEWAGMGLLAYSPLASGILSGKYQLGTVPQGSRASILPGIHGRLTPQAVEATMAYHEVAREARMDPVHMALAWHRTRPFTSVSIFGATTADQLGRILKGLDATVSPDLAKRIDRVHRAFPLPF